MHRIKNILIVAAACIAIATCSLQAKTKAAADPQKEIAGASNDFTVRICRQLAGEKGNLFFSPSSIHTALSMTLAGADKDNSPFTGVKRGDTIMTVNTGDDALIFVLRNIEPRGWLVIAERTDY